MDKERTVVMLLMTSLLMTSCLAVRVEIISPQQSVTVTKGTSVVIVCDVSDLTSDDIATGELIWGRIIASIDILTDDGQKYVIRTITNNQRLTSRLNITNMTYDDDAQYYCTWRQASQTSDFVSISVRGQPEIVNLTFDGDPIAGQALVVTCTVEGRPLPGIKWNGPLPISGQSSSRFDVSTLPMSLYKKKGILTIHNFTSQYVGSYSCKANSSRGTDTRDIELEIYAWGRVSESSQIERSPTTTPMVTSLGPVTLYCEGFNVPGDVNLKVSWYFKEEGNKGFVALRNDPRMEVVREADKPLTDDDDYYYFRSQLSFNALFSDQGIFQCQVLQKNVQVAQIDRLLHVRDLPHITLTPDTVGLSVGDDTEVTCTIESRPPVTRRYWLKNYATKLPYTEQEINDYTVNIKYNLEINENVDYKSIYTCVAANSYGNSSLNLKVQETSSCSGDVCTYDHEYCVDTGSSYVCLCESGYYRDTITGLCINLPTTTATTTTKRTTKTSTTTTEGQAGDKSSNTGLYAGIGAGVAGVIMIILVVVCIVVFRRRRQGTGGINNAAALRKLPDTPTAHPPSPPATTPAPTDTATTTTTYYSNTAFSPFKDPHDYTPLKPDPNEIPRDRLQLLEPLGHGKFGQVVRALALSLHTTGKWDTVAVKMHKETATDAEKSEFLKEMSLLRSLPRHPNVVSFLACCTLADPTLIIMEYCSKGDLLSYLRKRRPDRGPFLGKATNDLTARDFSSFALQVARGMAHVADNKIVHRDVAARNVLLSDGNVCKVSDFGLARRVDDASDVYEIVSKRPLPLRWMSPESLRDGIHTSKSDVWSFGILLWELVTLGASPYPGNTGKAVISLVTSGKRPEIPPQCSGELSDIMSSCWALVPEKRPNFDVVAYRFERLLEQEGDYLMLDNMKEGIYSILETPASGERL